MWGVMLVLGLVMVLVALRLLRRASYMTRLLCAGAVPKRAGPVHLTITCTAWVRKLPTNELVTSMLSNTMLKFKRFRCVVNGDRFVSVPVVTSDHLNRIQVADNRELFLAIEHLVNKPLDRSRPLWDCWLVENVNPCANDSTLSQMIPDITHPMSTIIIRSDHCVADGVSLVEVYSRLFTDMDGNNVTSLDVIGLKRRLPSNQWSLARQFVDHVGMCFRVLTSAPSALSMAFGPFDTATSYSSNAIVRRSGIQFAPYQKIAISPAIPFEFVKACKSKLSVSINDVLFAAFSGALCRYNSKLSDPNRKSCDSSESLSRALMPFAFPRTVDAYHNEDGALENLWTFVSARMFTNPMLSPSARVFAVQSEMLRLKKNLQPLANHVVGFLSYYFLPGSLRRNSYWGTFSRHSAVFANVPGPPSKMKMCGETVELGLVFFPNILPQVELLSYAGKICLTIVADPNVICDVGVLVSLFVEELKALGRELGINTAEYPSMI